MKNTKKVIVLLLSVVLGISSITACSSNNEEPDSESLKTVNIAATYDTLQDSAALAKNLGYIDDELQKVGYKAEYFGFSQAGPALNEALTAGSIDFGVYADFPQLVLFNKDVDVRAIAPVNSVTNFQLLVREDSGIKTPKDLEGKKVLVSTGTIVERIWGGLVAAFDIDESKVQLINAQADQMSIFAAGEADAVISAAVAIEGIKSNAGGTVVWSTEENPELAAVTQIVGRGEFLDANPEAGKAIVRALYRAYEYAVDQPEKAYEDLAYYNNTPDLNKAIYGYDTSFGYFIPEYTDAVKARLDLTNEFLLSKGLITEKVDLSKFIDSKYFDAVKDEFSK